MEDKIRMFINNEEVVSSNEFTINEEMLSASSTILNNCYPKDWELTKDYISNFYYPEDYSKLIIGKGNYEYGDTEYSILSTTSDNSNLEYETNVEKEWNKLEILGNSYQETSTSPQMPSPDYPSELVSIGYKNNLSLDYLSTFGITINDLELNDFTYTNCWGNILIATVNILKMLKPSTQYTISFKFKVESRPSSFGQYNHNSFFVLYKENVSWITIDDARKNTGTIGTWYNVSKTITTPSDLSGHNLLAYNYKDANNNTTGTIRISELIISEDKVDFIPHGKYGIEVKNISKNLFNNDTIQLGISWNNATSTARAINIIPVKPSTDYTISFNSISGLEGVYAFGRENVTDDTRTMGNLDITDTRTITTTANTHYLGLQFNKTSITKEDITNCLFQIEEGNQATTYEPYKENKQLYVLNQPLKAIGDYKDTMQIENNTMTITRRIKHIELAIANMNNSDEYPGWTNIPETAEIKVNYPSKNTTFYGAGIGYNSNIRIQNPTADYFALNTNGAGVIFLPKSANNSLTQTQWKTNYPNLIVELDYVLPTTTTEEIEGIELPISYEGQNYASIYSNVNTRTTIFYNWKNYDVLFSGVIKNSGEISLNPREPHYCSLQVLDYKTFLSECDTLDFVISNKTIQEAIQMVVNAVSGYGFILGNININQANDIIGAYSTLNQSPYDVLQYLANISGSRWRARYVDSSSMAIDFYDPDLLPQADNILYTKQYFEDNNIVDLTFSYGTRDYRNKQIVTSNEVYGDIDYTQNLYADGYTQEFLLEENIGNVKSVYLNGVIQDVITKDEKDNGVDGDFYYTPGKNTISSVKLLSVNNEIVVTYTPLIKGRQIVYNSDEVNRISQQTNTIGIISRYEIRNDIFSNTELNQVGQTYINFKGTAEILLTVQTENKDLFNIGEVSYFDAPINELKQYYMVKTKKINYIVINGVPTLFYEYQLTSSYNNEKAINYFDNQRNKAQGNIQLGQTIVRNIDIENETMIVWQNLEINEIELEIDNNNVLNNIFNSPFIE